MEEIDQQRDFPTSRDFPVASSRGWGQSDMCMVSGWGQAPEGPPQLTFAPRPWYAFADARPRYTDEDPYVGPVENWPNYKIVTEKEWETFRENHVVYTDGSNVVETEPGWFYCTLCSKKCASKDIMENHITSTKHLRSMEWLGRNPTSTGAASPVTPSLVLTEKDKEVLKVNRCVEEDGWIVCLLCNKKMQDMYFVPDHIGSRKHRNNLDWANSVDGEFCPDASFGNLPEGIVLREKDYYCNLCDVSMTSKAIMDVHISGTRHTRKLRSDLDILNDYDVPIRSGIPLSQLVQVLGGPSTTQGPTLSSTRPRPSLAPKILPHSIPSRRIPSPPRTLPPIPSDRWNTAPRKYQDLPDLIQIDV